MKKTFLGLAAAALALLGAAELGARKTEQAGLKFELGQSWSLEDTLKARIPDPQTGGTITPATKGVFRYRIEKVFSDGSAVVSVRVVSLQGGISEKTLKPLPVDHPQRPEQYALLTPEGRIYGPYSEAERRKRADLARDLSSWLAGASQEPWVWYKLPEEPLAVGGAATRRFGSDNWRISRLEDESLGGASCAVYQARWEKALPSVVETTWLDPASGNILKREVSEKRAKNVSSSLTQVRL